MLTIDLRSFLPYLALTCKLAKVAGNNEPSNDSTSSLLAGVYIILPPQPVKFAADNVLSNDETNCFLGVVCGESSLVSQGETCSVPCERERVERIMFRFWLDLALSRLGFFFGFDIETGTRTCLLAFLFTYT